MRKGLLVAWLGVLLTAIGFIFWKNDLVYSMPTPVPAAYKAVEKGDVVHIALENRSKKPLFLHFFNPECPCSRFNLTHFKYLAKTYGAKVDFRIVVLNQNHLTEKEMQEKYGLSVPVLFSASIATACGVYSTPQAAIIDSDNRLFYRGNYNKSRYCTDKKSNYAETALLALLQRKNNPEFDQYALKAYGCELPTCTK